MDGTSASVVGTLLEQRYRVDVLLARGGMSAVYRGLDTRLDRRVAIKVMDPRFASDRSFVDRFEREARSAARIHHPCVVAVHDQGVHTSPDGDLVYLVMELVDGGTLRDLIAAQGRLPVPLALTVLDRMLSALAAAHAAGLVHRDVKPENVLIGRSGAPGAAESSTVKVADFGLVRAIAGAGTTSSSVILGTVAYLSPEQVTTGSATARGDVYSAGIVLYEMLTGTPPYDGDTALSVAYRHVNDDVPAPSQVVPGLPAELDELVLRVTRREPAARPADAGAFLDELRRVREGLGIATVPVPIPPPASADRTVVVSASVAAPAAGEPVTEPAAGGTGGVDGPTIRTAALGTTNTGPRGTRALLRSELASVATQAPPGGPPSNGAPPSGPFPAPVGRHGVTPPRASTLATRRPVRWWPLALVAALLLAVAGVGGWWFTTGRWTNVPAVTGWEATTAEQALRDADLNPSIERTRHDTVAAGQVIETRPAGDTRALRGERITMVVSTGPPVVPDVRPGASVVEAQNAIREMQLNPRQDDRSNVFDAQIPKGTVVRLVPQPGTQLKINQPVTIVLSKGPPPKPVPDVEGRTRDEAFAILRNNGFEPVDGRAEFSADVDAGRVIRTDPPAGTTIDADDDLKVSVVVNSAVTVPDLRGRTLTDAKAALDSLGLVLDVQFGPAPNARVVIQNPGGNSRVERGTRVRVIATFF